ncbi:DEAD/DEAH box helicase family protein [Halosegnis longus]|uniref:DEAD/DEAH box helicase family protein n=1 Tax=Halosegnis longus TaxID=2216012 RepID=UPI00129DC79E|nr:DEAD/DEAH box helicase family protein [Halosegnis longus]
MVSPFDLTDKQEAFVGKDIGYYFGDRQSGKSTAVVHRAIQSALNEPVIVVAPNMQMAELLREQVLELCDDAPRMDARNTVALYGGEAIRFRTASQMENIRSIHGFNGDIIVDEAHEVPDDIIKNILTYDANSGATSGFAGERFRRLRDYAKWGKYGSVEVDAIESSVESSNDESAAARSKPVNELW